MEYNEFLNKNNLLPESPEKFEEWMLKAVKTNRNKYRQQAEEITIPVVVHIIHNGEPVGVGKNISEEQILSQLTVINEDFRRLNPDRVNTPDLFTPVAADIEINFTLAKQDPEGLPTNGINRINGGKDLWFIEESFIFKSLSYWPTEDYLNIWVTDLGDSFLGFAQFPVSNLGGLDEASNSRLTDGVMIDYRAFGSSLIYPPADLISAYNAGRTTTHEIGHYFGLRHTWGDGGCSVDDFCNDTPLMATDHGGLGLCTFPGPNSCTNESPDLPDMFQNYMDYTDDVCMNLFTEDQKTRMRVVLDNSPRRESLKLSLGGTAPIIVANDLGIRTILTPAFSVCGDSFTPTIEVRNYGTNDISSFQVSLSINGNLLQVLNGTLSLGLLEIDTLQFDAVDLGSLINGDLTIDCQVESVNNGVDGNAANDQKTTIVKYPENGVAPIRTDLNSIPTSWSVTNPDELTTWAIVEAPNGEVNNQALFMNFYDYENQGAVDLFSSPVIDLSNSPSAKLTFDVAYAKYPGADLESLAVVVGRQCVNPLSGADTIYYKIADDLTTVNPSTSYFSPVSSSDWRTEQIDLANYLGEEAIQITFIANNGYGNNLYLDNIAIEDVDNRIVSPTPVTCIVNQDLIIEVVNSSPSDISELTISYILDANNQRIENIILSSPLSAGFSTNVAISLPSLSLGEHQLAVEIGLPGVVENTTLEYSFYIDQSTDFIPIKETFSNFDASEWQVVNHDQDITWAERESQGREFVFIQNEAYQSIDQQDWLVSPSINFSQASTAILTFDVAYSSINNPSDGLSLYISTNCGESYDFIEYNKVGIDLATGEFNGNPTNANWRKEVIDLSSLLGFQEVRLAFVSTNRNGNNIYLDDIEVYVTDFISPTENILFPNPVENGEFNIRFSLNQKEDVNVLIYDRNGRLLTTDLFPATLNQRYIFDISNQPPGIYLVKINGQSFSTTKRVFKFN